MRIIAGINKGTTIVTPPGSHTRPTSDKVREAVFSILGGIEGLAVLDLFAGSGALGLEAISRGAADAVLVDSRPAAVKAMKKNVEKLKAGNAIIVRRDSLVFLKDAAKKGDLYDLIFVDPPYKMHRVIGRELADRLPDITARGGRVILESSSRDSTYMPWEPTIDRVYGDTRICVYNIQKD